jgi:hypothetical protein
LTIGDNPFLRQPHDVGSSGHLHDIGVGGAHARTDNPSAVVGPGCAVHSRDPDAVRALTPAAYGGAAAAAALARDGLMQDREAGGAAQVNDVATLTARSS